MLHCAHIKQQPSVQTPKRSSSSTALPHPALHPATPVTEGTSLLTEDQAFSLGKHSDWIGLMDTEEKVLKHYVLLTEHRKAKHAQDQAELAKSPVERARVKQLKDAQSNVVNEARIVWREACAARDASAAHHKAIVDAAHTKFMALRTGGAK